MKTCGHCGRRLTETMARCQHCGLLAGEELQIGPRLAHADPVIHTKGFQPVEFTSPAQQLEAALDKLFVPCEQKGYIVQESPHWDTVTVAGRTWERTVPGITLATEGIDSVAARIHASTTACHQDDIVYKATQARYGTVLRLAQRVMDREAVVNAHQAVWMKFGGCREVSMDPPIRVARDAARALEDLIVKKAKG